MDDAKRALVQAWLVKARNDFDSAKQLGALAGGHLDVAVYHCQQAAEKAVKGFLLFKNHPLERSRDIGRLIDFATAYEPDFANWEGIALLLTPYATFYRYPDEPASFEPEREEFEEALKCSSDLMNYVLSLLPIEVLEI